MTEARRDHFTLETLINALTASRHNTAACFDSAANPPTARSMSSVLTANASAAERPIRSSVSADPAAIDAVQPRVR